jgi:hypothetical protein
LTPLALVRKTLHEIKINSDVSKELIGSYLIGTATAPFLFNDEIVRYLQEIGEHASLVYAAKETLKTLSDDDEAARLKLNSKISEHLAWLSGEVAISVEKFKPFLKLRQESTVSQWMSHAKRIWGFCRDWLEGS